jgi:hypothetical protein
MKKPVRKNSSRGDVGEFIVATRVSEMEGKYNHIGGNYPSIDGQIQLEDPDTGAFYYLNVQVKTGTKCISGNKAKRKFFSLNLEKKHIFDWQQSNSPTIAVWVDLDDDSAEKCVLWADAKLARLGATKLRLYRKNLFNETALPKLLDIARKHAGRPDIARLRSAALFSITLAEVKQQAWEFYSQWRSDGSVSPTFGRVNITLRGWRHLTRPSSSIPAIIHKLSLLRMARELLETSHQSRFLRRIEPSRNAGELVGDPSITKELHSVYGLHQSSYQADIIVEVVLEVTKINGWPCLTKFYGVHEKRDWYT